MSNTIFVTFYSYKGGVGRTLALGNVAWKAAIEGKKVVIIDFDLEAPGIPSVIPFREPITRLKKEAEELEVKEEQTEKKMEKNRKGGLFELILEYQKEQIYPSIRDFYATEPIIDNTFKEGGEIYIIPAGLENKYYKDRLQYFNWQTFYEKEKGYECFNRLREDIILEFDNPDFVFIDSRTGLTDIGGICTYILPDIVVLLTGLNQQNIQGTKKVIKGIENYSSNERKDHPIEIITTVGSHVPYDHEQKLTEKKLKEAETVLGRKLEIQFNYVPRLSLEEVLLVQEDTSEKSHYGVLALPFTHKSVIRNPSANRGWHD